LLDDIISFVISLDIHTKDQWPGNSITANQQWNAIFVCFIMMTLYKTFSFNVHSVFFFQYYLKGKGWVDKARNIFRNL